jgi:YVTN family beta-propeller protein
MRKNVNFIELFPRDQSNRVGIKVGKSPYLAVDPSTEKVYVSNRGSNAVSVIDPHILNQTIRPFIYVGDAPYYIARRIEE